MSSGDVGWLEIYVFESARLPLFPIKPPNIYCMRNGIHNGIFQQCIRLHGPDTVVATFILGPLPQKRLLVRGVKCLKLVDMGRLGPRRR